MIRVVLCIVLAILGGCLNTLYNNHYAQLTSEDKSYLEKVWVQQKSFDVDKSEDGICWIRACNWITKYSRSPPWLGN